MSEEPRDKTGPERYEMLWDCDYCGTRKLLGKSHRHCPKCGAPQGPKARYFPSESERIAVEDHVYHGADRVCPACDTANSAAADFCVNCGAPTGDAPEVARVGVPEPEPPAAPRASAELSVPSRRSRRGCLAAVGGGILALAATLTSFCWTRAEAFRVAGHAWEHRIAVERFQTVDESGWRDAVPGDARDVSCSRQQRETREVPDGETCTTVDVDDGDGTFHQEERCETRYRSEPVYDDHCSWRADRWRPEPDRVASGSDLAPRWPETGFRACHEIGCRREAGRTSRYDLVLTDDEGNRHTCAVPEPRWRARAEGMRLRGRVRIVTGGVVCESLEPQ